MIHILKENKDLINTVYVIGDNLLKHLENTYKNYKGDKTKEGYKRLSNLIEMSKNGGIKFNEMKRLKNWFDNNSLNKETDEYKLNGGDLMKDFVITSDGKRYKNNRYTKKYQKKLAKAQKHLSRKKYGSGEYEKQRLKVAKIHEKIANWRNDNLHKVSIDLIRNYDLICVEDLNVKGMVKNHKLAKHIQDASWSMFLNYLQYKADWNNKQIIKIDRFYPSSQTCNECGYINKQIKDLSVREWTCPNCGKVHNRDVNAAKNILKEGLRNISSGTVDYTAGDEVKPSTEGVCQ